MKNNKLKCVFCNKAIGDQPPYNDGKDLYHTNCHFLIGDVHDMNKRTLTKLLKIITEALNQK